MDGKVDEYQDQEQEPCRVSMKDGECLEDEGGREGGGCQGRVRGRERVERRREGWDGVVIDACMHACGVVRCGAVRCGAVDLN